MFTQVIAVGVLAAAPLVAAERGLLQALGRDEAESARRQAEEYRQQEEANRERTGNDSGFNRDWRSYLPQACEMLGYGSDCGGSSAGSVAATTEPDNSAVMGRYTGADASTDTDNGDGYLFDGDGGNDEEDTSSEESGGGNRGSGGGNGGGGNGGGGGSEAAQAEPEETQPEPEPTPPPPARNPPRPSTPAPTPPAPKPEEDEPEPQFRQAEDTVDDSFSGGEDEDEETVEPEEEDFEEPSGGGGGGGGGGSEGAPIENVVTGAPAGKTYDAYGTFFDGCGTPFCGCGVPPRDMIDDDGKALPIVALNRPGPFGQGENCGRWIEAKLGKNCEGGSNNNDEACIGGSYNSDVHTGKTVYAYVADSCQDGNFWCKTDVHHLDLNTAYLESMDLLSPSWNGREVSWAFLDGPPKGWSMGGLKFIWKDGSRWFDGGQGFWATLIIYNVPNGIGKVEQRAGGKWVELDRLWILGQQFTLTAPDAYMEQSGAKNVELRVSDISGTVYGEYEVPFNCKTVCKDNTDVEAKAM